MLSAARSLTFAPHVRNAAKLTLSKRVAQRAPPVCLFSATKLVYSETLKPRLLKGFQRSRRPEVPLSRFSAPPAAQRRMGAVAEASAPLEVLVKSAIGEPDKLGDCPFCHRVLITLEEKNIPYTLTLVDLTNKPQWFLEANPLGKVPVLRKEDGGWLPDSDEIVKVLEEKFPTTPMKAPEGKEQVGSAVFGAFRTFLRSKDPSDGSEEALVDVLTQLDKDVTPGPFIGGDTLSSVDAALIPKLYHLQVALKHFKNWEVPSNLTHLVAYIKAVFARPSFQKTAAPEPIVIKGWERHLAA